jgi:hypothetical protein
MGAWNGEWQIFAIGWQVWSSMHTRMDVDPIDLRELTENFKSPCHPYLLRTICGEGRAEIENILKAQTSVPFWWEHLIYRIAEWIALKTSHAFCMRILFWVTSIRISLNMKRCFGRRQNRCALHLSMRLNGWMIFDTYANLRKNLIDLLRGEAMKMILSESAWF